VAQAVDAHAQPLAAGAGLRDPLLEQPLAVARRLEVARALQRGDGQQDEDEEDGRALEGG
jgi:hypothetical protein